MKMTILQYPVVDGKITVGNVAAKWLFRDCGDVSAHVSVSEGSVLSASYDAGLKEITLLLAGAAGAKRTEKVTVEVLPYAHPHPLAEARMAFLDGEAAKAKKGGILLIGDSLYDNWGIAAASDIGIADVVNLGVGGYTAANVQNWTLPRQIVPLAPRAVLLHVGINDMFQQGVSLEDYKKTVLSLIDATRAYLPDVKFCFLSIVRPTDIAPTVDGIVGEVADARRGYIDTANAWLRDYAAAHDNMLYVDAEAAYQDENGRGRVDLFYPDGIHILPAAYPGWGKLIGKGLAGV